MAMPRAFVYMDNPWRCLGLVLAKTVPYIVGKEQCYDNRNFATINEVSKRKYKNTKMVTKMGWSI